MNKKGFTLIELLAVIVILAVIALILVPVVSGLIENSKKASAARSVEGYIEAANNASTLYMIDQTRGLDITSDKHTFTSGSDELSFSKIEASGKLPTYVYLDYDINTKVVNEGHFCMDGYSILYTDSKGAKVSDTNYCVTDEPGEEAGDVVGSCTTSITRETPLFKYEANGTEDDYIYICDAGTWTRFKEAGLRWDGYFFNNGTYNAEKFSPTWNLNKYGYTAGGAIVTDSVTVTNQILTQYQGLYNTYSYYTNINGGSGIGVEYIMPIPIRNLGAGKIRIIFGANTTNDTASLYDFGLKTSATPDGYNAFRHLWNQDAWTNIVVASGRSSDFGTGKIVELPISSSLSNQDLYLAMQIGGLSNNTNSITVAISSIQFIPE